MPITGRLGLTRIGAVIAIMLISLMLASSGHTERHRPTDHPVWRGTPPPKQQSYVQAPDLPHILYKRTDVAHIYDKDGPEPSDWRNKEPILSGRFPTREACEADLQHQLRERKRASGEAVEIYNAGRAKGYMRTSFFCDDDRTKSQ